MQVSFIKTFQYGGSTRTLFALSRPLSDRAFPLRHHVLKIDRAHGTTWMEAHSNGDIMGFTPICDTDMALILAALPAAEG